MSGLGVFYHLFPNGTGKLSTTFLVTATVGMLVFAASPIYCVYALVQLKSNPYTYAREGSFSTDDGLTFHRPVVEVHEPPTSSPRALATYPSESVPPSWSWKMLVDPKLLATKVSSVVENLK